MTKNLLSIAILSIITISLFSAFVNPEATRKTVLEENPMIKRGEYLVRTMSCNGCHSPKKMGPRGLEIISKTLLSGHQASEALPNIDKNTLQNWRLFNDSHTMGVGPWGISFAANITSDPTGIGNWTFEQFKTCLTEGYSKGIKTNRMLLPTMPWKNFAKMDQADLKAIFAYLKSTKPVSNIVAENITYDKL